MCTNFKSTPHGHVKSPTFWNFLDFVKNLTHQDFFSKFKISCEKKLLLVSSMGYLSIKILTKFFFQNSKIFTSKMGRVWNEIFFKTLSAHRFLKVELSPQFRKFLNVWHIQNLEQPFLIWACNCLVKFWRRTKNFKIQNVLGVSILRQMIKNFP